MEKRNSPYALLLLACALRPKERFYLVYLFLPCALGLEPFLYEPRSKPGSPLHYGSSDEPGFNTSRLAYNLHR